MIISQMSKKPILLSFKKKNTNIPIWIMRQAGRYLPEYMEIRQKYKSFLDLCYKVKDASKITLQPLNRFYNLDAAIIFSDILVIPDLLGWKVDFIKNKGPILEQFSRKEDIKKLSSKFSSKIDNIYEMIALTKKTLPEEKTLIGFTGSAWSIAHYMLKGSSDDKKFLLSRIFSVNQRNLLGTLIDILVEKIIEFLLNQIKSGVETIQIFESWGWVLGREEFQEFVINPTKKIVYNIKKVYPQIPIICFPKFAGFYYEKYLEEVNPDGLGVDYSVPVSIMKKWQNKLLVQGNLDPIILFSKQNIIERKIREILDIMDIKGFIFNLGDGILPNTPLKNVEFLINYVKNFK